MKSHSHQARSRSISVFVLSGIMGMMLLSEPAAGGDWIRPWTGGGGPNDTNFIVSANWGGGIDSPIPGFTLGSYPKIDGTEDLVFGTGGSSMDFNLTGSLKSITINRAANFEIYGTGTLTLNSGGIAAVSSEVSRSHVISVRNLVLGAAQTWNVSGGGSADPFSSGPTSLNVLSLIGGGSANALTKTGNGTLQLTRWNTYQGQTSILEGMVVVGTLNHVASASGSFGAPTTVANGTIIMGSNHTPVLQLTGEGSVSNRSFQLGRDGAPVDELGGAIIENVSGGPFHPNGGPVILTASPFNRAANSPAPRTLTLRGNNGDANSIAGIIQNNLSGGAIRLLKEGSGTWGFSGNGSNTYSGGTTITNGVLSLDKVSAIAIPGDVSVVSISGSQPVLRLGGSGGNQIHDNSFLTLVRSQVSPATFRMNGRSETLCGLISTGDGNLVENGAPGLSTLTLTNTSYINLFGVTIPSAVHANSFSGVIRNGSQGTLALVKTGIGTQTLIGTNSYTGGTTVNGGTLVLNGGESGSGMINGFATVNSGATLRLDSAGSKYPTTGTDTLNINGGGTLDLKLGQISARVGTVNLSSENGSAAQVITSENSHLRFGVSANGLISSTGPVTNIWSAQVVLNGSIVGTIDGIPFGHIMNFNTAAGNTLNVTGVVWDHPGGEVLTQVYKTGGGTLRFSGANQFQGGTFVNGGTLVLNYGTFRVGIVNGTATVNNGAILRVDSSGAMFPVASSDTIQVNASSRLELAGGTTVNASSYVGTVNLSSGGVSQGAEVATSDGSNLRFGHYADGRLASSGPGSNSWTADMVLVSSDGLGPRRMVMDTADGNVLNVSGTIRDYPSLQRLPVDKTGGGTLFLGGGSGNTHLGDTTIKGGILVVDKLNATALNGDIAIGDGTASPGFDVLRLGGTGGNQIADASILTFNGTGTNAGVFRLNGLSETLGGLVSTGGAGIIENTSAGISILTLGNAAPRTFSGIIQDGGAGKLALVKTGAATQTLTGANTYTGDTRVENGTLSLSVPSLADLSTITIGSSAGSTAVLNLTHGDFDRVAALVIDGQVMPDGLYGSHHASGAITGSGFLWVGSSALFRVWIAGHAGLSDTSPDADPDKDGVSNLLEFVLNGNPNKSDREKLPTTALWSSNPSAGIYGTNDQYAFNFTRRADSIPEVNLTFQYSSDMKTWVDVPIVPPPSFMGIPGFSFVTLLPVVDGLQEVMVNIPVGINVYPKFFGRLKANSLLPGSSLPSGNLLQNGSGASPVATGWNIIANGGDGWYHNTTDGHDATPGFFRTSYGWCRRSQTIDLVAAGATEAALDAQPRIRVGEMISSFFNYTADSYYIKVELRDANQNVIATWNQGTLAAPLVASTDWVAHQHEFTNYGTGVRHVYFEDGGIDNGIWAGPFGTYHDAASVELISY